MMPQKIAKGSLMQVINDNAMALSLHFRNTMLHGPIANNTEQAEHRPLPFPRCFMRFAGKTEDERAKTHTLP